MVLVFIYGSAVSAVGERVTCAHLVAAEGVDEVSVDAVDGDPESHDDHILHHSFGKRVSELDNHRLVRSHGR